MESVVERKLLCLFSTRIRTWFTYDTNSHVLWTPSGTEAWLKSQGV